jgi:hypothetical protein
MYGIPAFLMNLEMFYQHFGLATHSGHELQVYNLHACSSLGPMDHLRKFPKIFCPKKFPFVTFLCLCLVEGSHCLVHKEFESMMESILTWKFWGHESNKITNFLTLNSWQG